VVRPPTSLDGLVVLALAAVVVPNHLLVVLRAVLYLLLGILLLQGNLLLWGILLLRENLLLRGILLLRENLLLRGSLLL